MSLPGIQNAKSPSLTNVNINHNEGLVIRQSRIENGKIIIPQSGLYYTSRSGKAEVLAGWKVFLLGKEFSVVDTKVSLEVIKNVDIEKGGVAPIGKTGKALSLSSVSMNSNGFDAPTATFEILKPSGNFYGSDFPVTSIGKLSM